MRWSRPDRKDAEVDEVFVVRYRPVKSAGLPAIHATASPKGAAASISCANDSSTSGSVTLR
jgi:hypothetical protein